MDEIKYVKYLGECVYIHSLKKLIIPHGIIKNNLIISMTTIPSRSKYILKTVNSLLAQTILPRQIYIGISDNCYREPNTKYSLPDELYNNPLITVVNNDNDMGPVMKLVTGINNSNKKDYIITVDDDIIYEKHTIEKLYNSARSDTSNSVHCAVGRDVNGIKILHSNEKINLETVEGYCGVIYNKQHFKSDFTKKIITYERYILMNDDLIISNYLKSNSIKIKQVNVYKYTPFYTFSSFMNPLYRINRNKNYFKKSYKSFNLFNAKDDIKY